MSANPIFDQVATEYPGIHRASFLFPQPAPEPMISFIRERGAWLGAESLLKLVRWSWT
jgi:hypothetical protein